MSDSRNRRPPTVRRRRGPFSQVWTGIVILLIAAAVVWSVRRDSGRGGAEDDAGRAGAGRTVVKMHVSAEAANVRSRPDEASDIVGRLEHRDIVDVDASSGEWKRITHEGGRAWVHGGLLRSGTPRPCEITSWGFYQTTVSGKVQNYTNEWQRDLRLRVIYYNDIGQIVNAGFVRLPDVPPANVAPEWGEVSFRMTTAPIGGERDVRILFGRLQPMTVTLDWSLAQERGVWWHSDITEPKIEPGESSAEMARRVLRELGEDAD